MSLNSRLNRLETVTDLISAEHLGQPIRPQDMSEQKYLEAIKAKRVELGLTPNQPLPILSLC